MIPADTASTAIFSFAAWKNRGFFVRFKHD